MHFFGGFFALLSSVAFCFDTQHQQIVCCYDWTYAGYPATFLSAYIEFVKILSCFKSVLENKNFCILLHKMILHMQKWGGSPLYPIFELQRI